MSLTLRDVLGSDPLQRGRPDVLTGSQALDNPVRWVHVSEVSDVSGLLSGGELILSTGLPLAGTARRAADYVRSLVAAGAAGLVVELGETLPAVPEAAVRASRSAGFPLVVLHATVRFVEVTEQVHRGIVAEQYAFTEFARSTHEAFTRLSLEAAGADRIVEVAAALCESSVVLEDLTRRVVAHTAVRRPRAGLLARWEERSRAATFLDGTGRTGPEGWMTTPVRLNGQPWGRLVVPDSSTSAERLAMVTERASQALELGRMAERDRINLAFQAQSGLLAELVAGRVPDEPEASARAAALALHPAPHYVAMAVHEPTLDAAHLDPLAEHGRTRRLVETVSDAVQRAGLNALVGSVRLDQVGLIASLRTRGGENRIADSLADALPSPLLVGVGPVSSTLLGAGTALANAQHVAEAAAALPGSADRRWFRNADVRLHGLIAMLHDDVRVQAFAESELAPLLRHDAEHGSNLLGFLRSYVDAGGSMTRMSQQAYRSRPALYKQLERVERILDVDVRAPASLLSLGVALMAYDEGRRRSGR